MLFCPHIYIFDGPTSAPSTLHAPRHLLGAFVPRPVINLHLGRVVATMCRIASVPGGGVGVGVLVVGLMVVDGTLAHAGKHTNYQSPSTGTETVLWGQQMCAELCGGIEFERTNERTTTCN